MKINFITVCTDNYPLYYAEKITNRFRSLTSLDMEYFCISDRSSEIKGWAKPIKPSVETSGWWNKVNLYGPHMPKGWLLYMDIDIVIQKNFDFEIMHTINAGHELNCISDAIGWMGVKFSSSLMILKSGKFTNVFNAFCKNKEAIEKHPGGDQVWAGKILKNINFIDDQFPHLKKNLKFDLGEKSGDKFLIPAKLPNENIKLVDCGGRPKPHELSALNYIKKNWHEVPTMVSNY